MICVFDFDAGWNQVLPHLHTPEMEASLDRCMEKWCEDRGHVWDKSKGPWYYGSVHPAICRLNGHAAREFSRGCQSMGAPSINDFYAFDDWCATRRDIRPRLNELAARCGVVDPACDTPLWYRVSGACYYIVSWQCDLAERVFPKYTWRMPHVRIGNSCHAFALGWNQEGEVIMFDIITYDTDMWSLWLPHAIEGNIPPDIRRKIKWEVKLAA